MWHFIAVFLRQRIVQVSAFFLIGFVVERLATADRSITKANRAFNCAYTVFFQVFDFTAGSLFAMYVYSMAVKMPGKGLISLPVSDRGILPFAIILAFSSSILRDFFYYWFHRLQHASRWLWAQHALHHSDECMNVTTTWRHHWLEMPMETVAVIVPAAILFKPPIVTIPLAYLITQGMSYFIHLNSRISLGPLTPIIAGPQTHRIHHSKLPEHIDKNFAAIFPLWDVIFGTYYHPKKGECPPCGLASGETVHSFRYALLMPFITWVKMLKRGKETH